MQKRSQGVMALLQNEPCFVKSIPIICEKKGIICPFANGLLPYNAQHQL